MVLGKLPVPGRPTIWFTVGQGPTALVVGAGGGCLDIFTLIYPFSPLSPSLWETARYRLKYCLKGPLNPKLPTYLPARKTMSAINRRILTDAVITSSSESILGFVIHCVYIQSYHVGIIYRFTEIPIRIV